MRPISWVIGRLALFLGGMAVMVTPPLSVGAGRSSPYEPPHVLVGSPGIWLSQQELAALATNGPAWHGLISAAAEDCRAPDLSNQNDPTNTCVLAKALVEARTGSPRYRREVSAAIASLVHGGSYEGRALALGRELAAYVIAADLIDLKTHDSRLDQLFRSKIRGLLTTPTSGGPATLTECQERRPNNWGTHCGASRAAVAAYLGDRIELARVARVFKGFLGDRQSYAGFSYGDLSWQCDPAHPVGINPNCLRGGHSLSGVLPDDQRRRGPYSWPPAKENYVYEALQGALVQAVVLQRSGYDVFNWQDKALLRAFVWLQTQASYPASGDDTWQIHLINHYYHTNFPAPSPSRPGKNMGWTDWTHPQSTAAPAAR